MNIFSLVAINKCYFNPFKSTALFCGTKADSADPDQIPQNLLASDHGLFCLLTECSINKNYHSTSLKLESNRLTDKGRHKKSYFECHFTCISAVQRNLLVETHQLEVLFCSNYLCVMGHLFVPSYSTKRKRHKTQTNKYTRDNGCSSLAPKRRTPLPYLRPRLTPIE